MIPLPIVRYRLGAEELIELGRTGQALKGHAPFLANRPRMRLGAAAGSDVESLATENGAVLTDALSADLHLLEKLSPVSVDIMSKSDLVAFKAVGDLLDHVPSIDVLLGQILLLGNASVKFALPLPAKVASGFDNILSGIAGVLAATGSGAQNQRVLDLAREEILSKVPDQDGMKAVLNAAGVTGDDLVPVNRLSGIAPANPPPAGAQGSSELGSARRDVLLLLSRG